MDKNWILLFHLGNKKSYATYEFMMILLRLLYNRKNKNRFTTILTTLIIICSIFWKQSLGRADTGLALSTLVIQTFFCKYCSVVMNTVTKLLWLLLKLVELSEAKCQNIEDNVLPWEGHVARCAVQSIWNTRACLCKGFRAESFAESNDALFFRRRLFVFYLFVFYFAVAFLLLRFNKPLFSILLCSSSLTCFTL